MFLDASNDSGKIMARVAAHLKERGMTAELVLTSIAKRGGEDSLLQGPG